MKSKTIAIAYLILAVLAIVLTICLSIFGSKGGFLAGSVTLSLLALYTSWNYYKEIKTVTLSKQKIDFYGAIGLIVLVSVGIVYILVL